MSTSLKLHQVSVSAMDNNCYLLSSGEQGLLIDAADEPDTLHAMARDASVDITAVLTTHRHHDHTRALEAVLEATGATHLSLIHI